MKRGWEIASGISVFVISVLNLMAVLKMVFYYQQIPQKVPTISIASLTITAIATLLSFLGAFILLSWSGKSK